ncbi:MAG TPA: NUDIX domain-containing protein [Gammaproteobacteria bacterium]|nr:NUDIX domain-containing protein [Gammaproteobacteria bacterium]
MKYCSNCGHPVTLRIPEGDNLPRYICDHCQIIHYQNPKIVTGCLPVWKNNEGVNQILLCRRAIEPRYGLWTLPAGFMENAETLEQAAERESVEEASANIDQLKLYTLISLPHVNQVYIMYLANLRDQNFYPGIESLDVRLFHEHEIPWDSLAFHTIHFTLEKYFQDCKQNHYPVHTHTINTHNGKSADQ